MKAKFTTKNGKNPIFNQNSPEEIAHSSWEEDYVSSVEDDQYHEEDTEEETSLNDLAEEIENKNNEDGYEFDEEEPIAEEEQSLESCKSKETI